MGLHLHRATKADLAWYHTYFAQLVGAKITDFDLVPADDSYWPTYTVELASGKTTLIELSQDEEGNGPGWLFGLNLPPAVGSES